MSRFEELDHADTGLDCAEELDHDEGLDCAEGLDHAEGLDCAEGLDHVEGSHPPSKKTDMGRHSLPKKRHVVISWSCQSTLEAEPTCLPPHSISMSPIIIVSNCPASPATVIQISDTLCQIFTKRHIFFQHGHLQRLV